MCFDTGKDAECAVQLQTAHYAALLLLENSCHFRRFLFVGFLTLLPPPVQCHFGLEINLFIIFWGGVGGCAFFFTWKW